MDASEIASVVASLIDSLGTVGILIWAWVQERKRADAATNEIVQDWKRQNDREKPQSVPPQ